jgi:hypothetical protein
MSKNKGKKVQKKHQHEGLLNFTFESVEPSKENMQQTVRLSVAYKFFLNWWASSGYFSCLTLGPALPKGTRISDYWEVHPMSISLATPQMKVEDFFIFLR